MVIITIHFLWYKTLVSFLLSTLKMFVQRYAVNASTSHLLNLIWHRCKIMEQDFYEMHGAELKHIQVKRQGYSRDSSFGFKLNSVWCPLPLGRGGLDQLLLVTFTSKTDSIGIHDGKRWKSNMCLPLGNKTSQHEFLRKTSRSCFINHLFITGTPCVHSRGQRHYVH